MSTNPHLESSAEEVLDFLDEWFFARRGGYRGHGLWAVLTALRGPDAPASFLTKQNGTEVIRQRAFPKTAGGFSELPACFATPNRPLMVEPADCDHFKHHLTEADDALRAMGK